MRNIVEYFREHSWQGVSGLALIGLVAGYFGSAGLYLLASVSIGGSEISGEVIGSLGLRSTRTIEYVYMVNDEVVRSQIQASLFEVVQADQHNKIMIAYNRASPELSLPKSLIAVYFLEHLVLMLVSLGSLLLGGRIVLSLTGRFK